MKRNTIPKSALVSLIIGLLMTTLTPLIGRYFLLPDFIIGFLNGIGLAVETFAIIKISQSRKNIKCTVSNN